jgi:signal transduction histidine kinase
MTADRHRARRVDPVRSVRLAAGLLVVLVVGLGAWLLIQTYKIELRESSQSLGNEAVILGESVQQLVSSANAFLYTAATQVRFDNAGNMTNQVQMQSLLREWSRRMPLVASFVIATADGRRIIDTRVDDDRDLPDVRSTQSYAWAKNDRTGEMGIIGPGRTAIGDRPYVLSFVRSMRDAHGRFLGLIVEVLNVEKLAAYFAQVDLGKAAAITLFRREPNGDYPILARFPYHPADYTYVARRDAPNVRWLSKTPDFEIARARSPIDSVDRLLAVRELANYPLAMVLARPWRDVIGSWYSEAALILTAMIVVIAFIASVAGSLVRQVRARVEVERQAGLALANQRRGELEVQRSKLDALARLSGGVAHEFNNLLQPIKTLSGLGQHLAAQPNASIDRLGQYFQRIHKTAETASSIAADFLTFCGSDQRPLSTRNLSGAVREAIEQVRPLIAAPDELDLQAAPGVEAQFDDLGLSQVLLNLVKNALEAHMSVKGAGVGLKIAVSVQPAADGGCVLTVSDNGPGMTDDVRARVFEPFFTTKRADGGTGLGLAVVYGIVTGWGGQIAVDSRPGSGARFTVTLPSPHGDVREADDVARSSAA